MTSLDMFDAQTLACVIFMSGCSAGKGGGKMAEVL